jgi:hypothetical protein
LLRKIAPGDAFHPQPPLNQPNLTTEITWGAIGFTADGSYSTTWKMPSQPEAEARAAKGCAQLGRGRCEGVSFSGQQCGALATFIGPYRRRRWVLSFTAGGGTYPEAQNAALARCNTDERSQWPLPIRHRRLRQRPIKPIPVHRDGRGML